MPRKMSGSAMSMIDALIVAIRTPSVVLDSTIHLSCGRDVSAAARARFRAARDTADVAVMGHLREEG